jgi:hypothetical protein
MLAPQRRIVMNPIPARISLPRLDLKKEKNMEKEKWMKFINHLWLTMSYWQLTKACKENNPPGLFFELASHAFRNELLMQIDHSVHLCRQIAANYDVGSAAEKTLKEINDLHQQGETSDRAALVFEDCGVKPFRDKVLAHPLGHIKELLGKGKYELSLKWATVEQTLNKIKQFADEVEQHNLAKWDLTSYKERVDAVDFGFQQIMLALKNAAKYDQLKLAVSGKVERVYRDWEKDEIVIEKE